MRLYALFALAACARHADRVPSKHEQQLTLGANVDLVTAVIDDWSSTKATMRAWHREGAMWKQAGEAWQAVIGKNGAAWGDGLHGIGVPEGRTGPTKQEGDRKSPAGAFQLVSSFGYDRGPQAASLPYTRSSAESVCVDDPTSPLYGQIGELTGDFKSFEKMRRDDGLYELGIVVDHNHAHTPGHGSCIFLHVWGGPDSATVGCTAMAKPELVRLVTTLAPGRSAFVLLPRDEYRALSEPWGLPAQ